MTAHRHLRITIVVSLALAMMLAALPASAALDDGGPPRYPVRINSDLDLLQVLAAGLVGDAFGYDSNEVLHEARATGMPLEDIVPTFYVAYLSGNSFAEVVELRSKEAPWGQIVRELDVTADTLNRMPLPRDITVSDPVSVPDEVYLDMFIGAALSNVFELPPETIFGFYEEGWHAIDVMAAVEFSYRSRRPIEEFLNGEPRQLSWLEEARQARIDIDRIAAESGRAFDNMVPVMAEEPQRGDMETVYAMELASDYWDVPLETVRRVRHRYLLSPPEIMVTFYVSNIGHLDYWNVGRRYAWTHWRRWGPTIADLRIPTHHFSGWSIWHGGPVDFYGVDYVVFHDALLGYAVSYGPGISISIYDRYDPWFGPHDAILWSGLWYRHHVPFDTYYGWHRSGRPWHHQPQFVRDHDHYRHDANWRPRHLTGNAAIDKTRLHPVYQHGRYSVSKPRPGPGYNHHSGYAGGHGSGPQFDGRRTDVRNGPGNDGFRDDGHRRGDAASEASRDRYDDIQGKTRLGSTGGNGNHGPDWRKGDSTREGRPGNDGIAEGKRTETPRRNSTIVVTPRPEADKAYSTPASKTRRGGIVVTGPKSPTNNEQSNPSPRYEKSGSVDNAPRRGGYTGPDPNTGGPKSGSQPTQSSPAPSRDHSPRTVVVTPTRPATRTVVTTPRRTEATSPGSGYSGKTSRATTPDLSGYGQRSTKSTAPDPTARYRTTSPTSTPDLSGYGAPSFSPSTKTRTLSPIRSNTRTRPAWSAPTTASNTPRTSPSISSSRTRSNIGPAQSSGKASVSTSSKVRRGGRSR